MIREAEFKDIVELNKLGSNLIPNFLKTYDLNNYINNSNYVVLIYEESNIEAFLLIRKNLDFYEIEALYVNENQRKKGIASKLLTNFLDNYLKNGEEIILEVNTNNTPAINLYKKFAFFVINTRKKYYNNEDAFVMKRVV